MAKGSKSPGKLYLGIEGGGTRTVGLLVDSNGRQIRRSETGPANVKLLTDSDLLERFKALASSCPRPDVLAIGLAGAWAETDRNRMRAAAEKVWPRVPCYATNDLETAITAAGIDADNIVTRVLLISGTGSCCYGESPGKKPLKVGGWGHVLGDKGSGYEIGLLALKGIARNYDETGIWPDLGNQILRSLLLNEPDQIVVWVQAASKADIAALAVEVFRAWAKNDPIATQVVHAATSSLVRDAIVCARRLGQQHKPVEFILAGSTLLKQTRFASIVSRQLKRLWPKATILPLQHEGAWGAVELARRFARRNGSSNPESAATKSTTAVHVRRTGKELGIQSIESKVTSPTEKRNPRSMNLDKLPIRKAIDLMLAEESRVCPKLKGSQASIEAAIRLISRKLKTGGRLFYVGSGTSGRLGVLDASECPPTFRTPPELIQGIIAGGQTALWSSVEGAEDSSEDGAQTIRFRGVNSKDVVVGIAASGKTPFVWGALCEAKSRRAGTILVSFNPYVQIPQSLAPAVVVSADLGPEVLTGSTRLKAGTATKIILNLFTTLTMVQLGKVKENLMIDMLPANSKLRQRAVRIVEDLTGADEATAASALKRHGWVIKKAVSRLSRCK